jgi:ADP-ribose pyrophosphatase YjhB (NUDIX family)
MANPDDQLSDNELWLTYPSGKLGKNKFCRHCARYNSRHVTTSVIGKKKNKVLMVLRALDPQAGYWALPGGYLHWDETAEEAAQREFIEETGYRLENLQLQNVYSDLNRDLDGRQNIDLCFVATVAEKVGEPDHEVADCQWFSLDKLPKKIAFDHRQMLEDASK